MQEQLVSLTKELVRIPSVSDDIQQLYKIIAYVQNMFVWYEKAVIEIREYNHKPSLIIQNFSGKHADVVMSWHLDVVPAQSEALFEPREEDGKLFGRWCGDMKDGCSIIITLMQQLLATWYTDKKVSLWLTTDEETWWGDGVGALVNDGYGWKVVLIPDAGDYTYVTYASKGIITIDVEITWKAAHSSRPWKWDNALEKVYALYQAIKKELENEEALYDTPEHRSPSVQLTKCFGWIASNVIPHTATWTINIRFTEVYTQEKIMESLRRYCNKYNAEILRYESWPFMYTNPENQLLKSFTSIVHKVTGKEPSLDKEHGTTDGRYFPDETIVLLYQPTDDYIHTDGEYTTIAHLEDVYTIYERFIKETDIE